jgi:hypothetical protein
VARLPGAGLPFCHRGCCRCRWGWGERSLAPCIGRPLERRQQGELALGTPVVPWTRMGGGLRAHGLKLLGRRFSLQLPPPHLAPCPRPSSLLVSLLFPQAVGAVKCGLQDEPSALAFAPSAEVIVGGGGGGLNRRFLLAGGRGSSAPLWWP